MAGRQKWSYNDDYLCCERYLYFSVGKSKSKSINDLIDELAERLPHLSRGSLRMKLQNIKYISEEMQLNDMVQISSLDQYSAQSKRAFIKALNDIAKRFTDEPEPETAEEREKRINKDIEEKGRIVLSQEPDDIYDTYAIFYKHFNRLIDYDVDHVSFGSGKISSVDDNFMTVDFGYRAVRFIYPDAFEHFISFRNKRMQNLMSVYLKKTRGARKRKSNRGIGLMYDKIEDTQYFLYIEDDVNELVYSRIGRGYYLGYCHLFWETKEEVLKEIYDINWNSPSKLNPRVCFD